jgi:ribonuclease P protein component
VVHPDRVVRIVQSVDFERVLRTAPRARSTHFAIHHLAGSPLPPGHARKAAPGELSTGVQAPTSVPVDDPRDDPRPAASDGRHWLGAVVPKRHARRSVTRTLIKRSIRSQFANHAARLPAGLWVVRLRGGFAVADFPSAASPALQQAASDELDAALARAAQPAGRPSRP